jgi:hypothetical protein
MLTTDEEEGSEYCKELRRMKTAEKMLQQKFSLQGKI